MTNTANDNKEYRSLCEQGDLGLFGELFNEADQKTLNDYDKKNRNNENSKNN